MLAWLGMSYAIGFAQHTSVAILVMVLTFCICKIVYSAHWFKGTLFVAASSNETEPTVWVKNVHMTFFPLFTVQYRIQLLFCDFCTLFAQCEPSEFINTNRSVWQCKKRRTQPYSSIRISPSLSYNVSGCTQKTINLIWITQTSIASSQVFG